MTTVLTAAALVALVALEFVLEGLTAWSRKVRNRAFSPHYPWMFCTTTGCPLGPDRGYLQLALHPAALYANLPNQRTPYFTTNSLGLRGGEPRPGGDRVLVLGGSTAFGTGLASDAHTIPVALGELLCAEGLNGGVIGYQSGQELALYASRLVDLSAGRVVSVSGWNDFSQVLNAYGVRGQRLPQSLLGFNWFQNVEDALAAETALRHDGLLTRMSRVPQLLFPELCASGAYWLRAVRSYFAADGSLERFREWMRAVPERGADSDYYAQVANAFSRNMKILNRLVASSGGTFLCVLQPVRGRELAAELYGRFCRDVQTRLESAGVAVLNLGSGPTGLDDTHFLDSIHLNAAGSRSLAALIACPITPAGTYP